MKPALVWLTGIPSAGKSTLADALHRALHARGVSSAVLDGDAFRRGVSRDLGFSDQDRRENARRAGEVAELLMQSGLVVIAAFVSPYEADRRMIRALCRSGSFMEVHVHAPLEVAEQRDVKGLYKRARAGLIKDLTGLQAPYEAPATPDVCVDTAITSLDAATAAVLDILMHRISATV